MTNNGGQIFFTARNTFSNAWKLLKERPAAIIGATVILILFTVQIHLAYSAIESRFEAETTADALLLIAVSVTLYAICTYAGMIYNLFLLRIHDRKQDLTSNIFPSPVILIYGIVAAFLTYLAILGGILLLIIPGIVLCLMFTQAQLLIVDKKLLPIQAMRISARITHGHKWKIFGLLSLLGPLNILGILLLGVGLLVTVPLTNMTLIAAYRLLLADYEAKQRPPQPIA